MQIMSSGLDHNKKQVTTITLLGRLLRKGITLISRLTTFRYGTVMIFRHVQFHDLPCPAVIRRVNRDNMDDALHMEVPEKVAEFRALLQRGDAGYYAYLNEAVVHRSWVQFGPGIAQCELGVMFRLEAGDSYVHHSKTYPNARGQGIYMAVLSQISHDMRVEGRNVFIATVQSNPASIRGIEKAGFRLLRRVRSIICFGVPVWQADLRGSI